MLQHRWTHRGENGESDAFRFRLFRGCLGRYRSWSSSSWAGLSIPGTRIAADRSSLAFCSASASFSSMYSSALSPENSLSEIRKSRRVLRNRIGSDECSNIRFTNWLTCALINELPDKMTGKEDVRLHVLEGVGQKIGNIASEVCSVRHAGVRNGRWVEQRSLDGSALD